MPGGSGAFFNFPRVAGSSRSSNPGTVPGTGTVPEGIGTFVDFPSVTGSSRSSNSLFVPGAGGFFRMDLKNSDIRIYPIPVLFKNIVLPDYSSGDHSIYSVLHAMPDTRNFFCDIRINAGKMNL